MSQEGQSQEAPQGTMEITVQNIGFTISAPYAEGHVLTKAEAGVLNQTRAENLRNNFAGVIKKKLEEIGKEEPPRSELSDDELGTLRAQFEEYESTYEFQGKRSTRAPVDPVRREAVKIARETITAALKKKNLTPSQLVEGKMDQLINDYLSANPSVMDEAKARVEKVKAEAADALAGVDLDGAIKPEEETPAAQ